MAHPARQRLADLILQALGHEQIGRRAGSAVEVFVTATHGEIRVGAM